MARKTRHEHGSPSLLVGEDRPSHRRGPGEGSRGAAEKNPSPRLASLATPLAQGERGRVLVARFGAPHGLRGDVKLWSFTEDPLGVTEYGPLEAADGRTFKIESLRPAEDFLVARVPGVNDRTAAEALTNIELYVPRERLPEIDEDETWYVSDLIGLAALAPDGAQVGTVTAVHNFGAGEVIEIAPASGGQTILLAFTESAVSEVNVKVGRMTVVLPSEDDDVARVGPDDLS